MMTLNIFKWIGELFTDILFIPFNTLREIGQSNWWSANVINWVFLAVLIVLLWYWMKESRRFVKEGTEDRA